VTFNASILLMLLIELVIGGLIIYVLFWFINYVAPPEPVKKVALVILALAVVMWLVNILMGLGGHAFIRWTNTGV
jgi:uncharacterized BrkB/YihY/UPF0761 family membrane protein